MRFVILFLDPRYYTINCASVLQREATAKGEPQHLVSQVSQEKILPLKQDCPQFFGAFELGSIQQLARIVHWFSTVLIAPSTNGIVIFERESHGVDAAVAAGAIRVGSMPGEAFTDRGRGRTRRLISKRWHVGRRRRRGSSKHGIENPGPTKHWAGAIRIGGNDQHRRHAEQTAAIAAFRQFHPLRLRFSAGVQRKFQIQMLFKQACADSVGGIDQVQHREIADQEFAEKERGLQPDVGAQVFTGCVAWEEFVVGNLIRRQFAGTKPLIDEALSKAEGALILHHAWNDLLQHFLVLQLTSGGDVGEKLIGHAAPQEVGDSRG